MKRFKFIHLLTMLVVIVTLASCGFTQPGYGEEEYSGRPVRSRSVYVDPYYSNAPVIVRDPYTGRYYEVTPVSPYGYDPYYGTTYPSYGRTYGGRSYSNNYPRRYQSTQPQAPKERSSETINKAKNIIRKD